MTEGPSKTRALDLNALLVLPYLPPLAFGGTVLRNM